MLVRTGSGFWRTLQSRFRRVRWPMRTILRRKGAALRGSARDRTEAHRLRPRRVRRTSKAYGMQREAEATPGGRTGFNGLPGAGAVVKCDERCKNEEREPTHQGRSRSSSSRQSPMNISTITDDRNTPVSSRCRLLPSTFPSGSVPLGCGDPEGAVRRPSGRPRACGYCHNSTLTPGRYFWLREGGTAVQIHTRFVTAYPMDGTVRVQRGVISEWSRKSMHRCITAMQACPWHTIGLGMLTLTYPAEYPRDGREVRRHRNVFMMRLRRRYPEVCGIWKVEFQRRGAPHLHVWVGAPEGTRLYQQLSSRRERGELIEWVSRAWFEVVASDDIRHLRAGTRVDAIHGFGRGHPLGYFKGYMSKQGQKQYQNDVPENYGNVGRFWAFFGGFGPEWNELRLDRREFYRLRRVLRAYFDRPRAGEVVRRRRRPYRRVNQGGTLWLVHGGDRWRLLKWLLGDEVLRAERKVA